MSPRRGRDPWSREAWTTARRIDVEGGVAVARPGRVATEAAAALVARTEHMTGEGIRSRGRTYARKGQVVEVRLEGGVASAAVQGSDDRPYRVSLGRDGPAPSDVEAGCTCPYGSDAHEWCKHAAALAYVVAHLVDTRPDLARAWTGEEPAASPGAEEPGVGSADPGEAASLRQALLALAAHPPRVDGPAQWEAAGEVVPLPVGRAGGSPGDPA